MNRKLVQQNKLHQDPDINLISYTNQHVKMIPARPKNLNPQQEDISRERIKDQKDYLSNDTDTCHRYNRNYQPPVFVQNEISSDSIYSKEKKLNIIKSCSGEPTEFYNDFNLEQVDRHGTTLELSRSST
ncbi:unnamed protein product [Rotaria sp. Silwood1]|nr:unnamed protein product [Rotaria sp. Silwood1]CAF1458542.1 unnamed protein product [Rotaria sp. Silwood1]CAF1466789.1 unnamed protein product [Rotaria sp. Silwood1]CAF3637800.1 unnamed protein product [Rotaria sp. Silwood1]CAF3642238.1 unnamed protein product [Rotaria sp. Silwood1]